MDKYRAMEIIPLFVDGTEEERTITQRVSHKALEVVKQFKNKYFEDLEISIYPSKWKTLCIDFENEKGELSLEIGYLALGYFTNDKQIDRLIIEREKDIKTSVIAIETDLEKIFYG